MLPKKNRVKKKGDIEKVLRGGEWFRETFLVLKKRENKLKDSRFGFIVSQKVSKKAVVRNKIKRRLRESVMPLIKKIKSGQDFAFIALPKTETKNFLEIDEVVKKILNKAKVL